MEIREGKTLKTIRVNGKLKSISPTSWYVGEFKPEANGFMRFRVAFRAESQMEAEKWLKNNLASELA